jgi:translation initiation factor 1A
MAYGNYRPRGKEQVPEVVRVRIPRGTEILGMVEEMLGAGRFRINCSDKKTRICRVSGKFKRKQWIRPGDVVLVEPWVVESDAKGDVIWKYRRAEIEWMRKKGIIQNI